jgi:hypothetical protein
VVFGLENSTNAQVYIYTVYTENYSNSIEYRFSLSTGNHIANNLTNRNISSRDGAQANVQNNYTSANSSMFVNYSIGDLHLASNIAQVVNMGILLPGVLRDYDCQLRPIGAAYDIGGDEFGSSIGINQISSEVPQGFSLLQNYPNPFNPFTKIKFLIPAPGFVTLTIYTLTGKEIEKPVNLRLNAGVFEVSWDGSNYPSGVYYYKIAVNNTDFIETKKMVLVK